MPKARKVLTRSPVINQKDQKTWGYSPESWWLAWGWNFVKPSPALGWQDRQVSSRFASDTDYAGSAAGRIEWAVWHAAHVAARSRPSWEAWP